MRLFAVRMIKDQQPIGFFWADDLAGLVSMVDEVAPPVRCEYKPINEPAAIIWPSDITTWKMGVKTLPPDADGGDADMQLEVVLADLHFEDALFEFVCGGLTIEHWKDLGEIARDLNYTTKYPRA